MLSGLALTPPNRFATAVSGSHGTTAMHCAFARRCQTGIDAGWSPQPCEWISPRISIAAVGLNKAISRLSQSPECSTPALLSFEAQMWKSRDCFD
jgi:hypothetical protein